ncbi:MAG: DegT/DnrJ/EryC1/StrS family aminotransferase [Deltaproteobacteria bacterium]|nr:DegT/DnrJ/EryC1/StrS family aminotransferase [Deltaproteobacteria bacterium]
MISFASPSREHAASCEAIEAAALRVLRSGSYVLGSEVEQLEAELARATGSPFAIGVSSGTDALVCALHALQIGDGHEVIVPAFGFVAAPEAVIRVGARPVFVDLEPITLGPAPKAISNALSPRTRAVIVMHLFGQSVDLEPIRQAAGDAAIIEDAAQGIGTLHGGRQVGTLAELGTLSFFPAKSLGAAGDAGAVLTSSADLAARVRMARCHGAERAYRWEAPGGNYRLDALQAAILRVKLAAFPQRIQRRKQIGQRLAAVARSHGVEPLVGTPACEPTFAPFALRLKNRDPIAALMRERGIDVRTQYPLTLAACPAFRAHARGAYPEADRATRELLSLPCHAELTDAEVDQLHSALEEALTRG